MDNKIERLNDLIELYKSNTITEVEYKHLKKELFFDSNSKVNSDLSESKTGSKASDVNQNNYQKETFYNSKQ